MSSARKLHPLAMMFLKSCSRAGILYPGGQRSRPAAQGSSGKKSVRSRSMTFWKFKRQSNQYSNVILLTFMSEGSTFLMVIIVPELSGKLKPQGAGRRRLLTRPASLNENFLVRTRTPLWWRIESSNPEVKRNSITSPNEIFSNKEIRNVLLPLRWAKFSLK